MFDINTLTRSNVLAMTPYSSARDEYKSTGSGMIFLDANENPIGNGLNRYPDPQQIALKSIIGRIKAIDSGQILLGNGSDEILDLIYRAFCNPGVDNIITLPPTYGMYSVLASVNDIAERKVNLTADFQPDVANILQEVDAQTKILFLCSPNNPTGNLFTEENITKLLTSFQGLVVIDEAYIDFSSAESWISKMETFPNLIVVQTFSKAKGLAGIRLGACFASTEIINILKKIKPPYNVNSLTQDKAINSLSSQNELMNLISDIKSERKLLKDELTTVDFVAKVYDSEANFLLVQVDDAPLRYRQLLERGIVIRDRSNQPLCQNCLRITVGTSTENKIVINSLKKCSDGKN